MNGSNKKLYTRLIYILLITLGITFSMPLFAQFNVIGNANYIAADDCYLLTGAFNTQYGAIWSNELIDLNESFEAQFQLYLGDKDGGGADGIAFTFQPVNNSGTVGDLGGGIGFEGIVPSVGIEFDTWQNGIYNDPAQDHVALMQNGILNHTQALTSYTLLGNIEDDEWHDVRVTWDAGLNRLKVYWECTSIITYEGDLVANIFSDNPMVYWGFTSATGAANNEHKVRIDYISFISKLPDHEICDGETIPIGAANNPDFTYSWTPAATLNNPNISNPVAFPSETTTYFLETTDECNFSFFDTLEVVVKPKPEIEIWEGSIEACEGESIFLDATTPDAEEYEWNVGGSDAILEVTQVGFYSIEVTVEGCSDTDGVFVDFLAPPFLDLGEDISKCENEDVLLDATVANSTYQWQNNATTATILATSTGIYTVTITSTLTGCTALDEISVSLLPLPSFDLGENQVLCEGETTVLDASAASGVYEWQDGSTTSMLNVTQSGTYTVTVTGESSSCSAVDEVSVTISPLPQFDLGPPQTLCEGETTILDAGIEGGIYQWSNGMTSSSIAVTTSGLYGVTVSYNSGCSTIDFVNVDFNPLPTVELGEDVSICEGGSTTLVAIAPSVDTYEWQDGSFLPVFEASEEGTYAVTVTAEGCKGSDQVNVSINPLPTFGFGVAPVLCEGESFTLNAPESDSYVWQDGSTNSSFEVSEVGVFAVTITQGECQGFSEIEVAFSPLPIVDLGEDQILCEGETTTLVAPESDTYLWQDGSTDASFEVSEAGIYAVTITQNNCSSSDEVEVSFNELPIVELGEGITLCEGQTITLDATPQNVTGATFLWNDNSTGASIEVNEAGTYSVTVSVGDCESSDEIVVDFNANPSIDLGEDQTLCEGETITLDATVEGATYLWQDDSTNPTFEVSEAGEYSVTVDLEGCILDGSITIDYNPLPTIDLGEDISICEGETTTLDATTVGATYLWQDGSTEATFEVSENGIYSVEITVNGCTAMDEIGLAQITLPPIDLGEDISICEGESVAIGLDGIFPTEVIFGWQDGSGGQFFEVTESGIYTLTASINQCMVTDDIEVNFNEVPTVDLGEDVNICEGETATLDATNAAATATYLWSNEATSPSIEVQTSGIYSVTVTNNNCSTSDEIELIVNSLPETELGEPMTFCEGENFVLDATVTNVVGVTYLWQDGSNAPTFDTTVSGVYEVTVSANACESTDFVNLVFNALPEINLGGDLTLCEGESLQLDASVADVAAIYEWQDGTDTPMIDVSNAGTYAVTVTVNACSSSDEITVNFDEEGLIDLGEDATLCEGETLVLNATTDGGSYVWQDDSTSPTFEVTEAGTYSVAVTVGACTLEGSIEVVYNALPTIDLGEKRTICEGETATLDATTAGATYLWQDDSTNPTFEASQGGIYSVTIEVNGCTATDFVEVERIELPAIDLGEDQTLCEGLVLALNIGGEFPTATFEWQDGTLGQDYLVSESGTYAVSVSIGDCMLSEELVVAFNEVPVLELQDVTLCEGETSVLTPFAEDSGTATYVWSNGLLDSNIEVGESGTYTVTVTDNGCTSIAEAEVVFDEAPVIDLGQDTVLCGGEILTLTAPAADTYQWQENGSDGATTASIEVSESGLYSVEARAGTCVLNGEIQVDFVAVPTVDLGDDILLCEGEGIVLQPEVTDAVEFIWQDGSSEADFAVIEAGEYTLEVRGELEDCSAFDAVRVDYEICEEPVIETFEIIVPSAFSPNGDGINDDFLVFATDQPEEFHFAIFNRWGEKIFETNDINGTWNGEYKDQLSPIGVYAFYAEAWKTVNGKLERFWKQGNVTLIR